MKSIKIILCAMLLSPSLSMAESLSLEQAYQKALQYDATLGASRAENNAQQQEIDKAFAAFLPQARLSMYKGRGSTDSETPGPFGQTISRHSNYESENNSLSVRQSIFNKANYAEYNQAKAVVAKSDKMLIKEQLNLISRVMGAYFDALLAIENINFSQAQKLSIESQLKQANQRFKAGVGTITEISEAQANLDDLIAKSLEWANQLEYAKQALENLTGEYPERLLGMDPQKLSLSLPQPDNVEAWISIALENNPDIIALQYDMQYFTQEIEKNKAGHYPTLDLVASKTNTTSDNNFTIGSSYKTDSVGLQLNVPIYSGGYFNASVRQSLAQLEQSIEKVTERQRAVSADIRKYFNAINNGIAKIKAFDQSVKSNQTAVIGTQKGYESGMRTNVDVLNAQAKLYAVKRDLAKERYQLIFNTILIKQSAGILTSADVLHVASLFTIEQ